MHFYQLANLPAISCRIPFMSPSHRQGKLLIRKIWPSQYRTSQVLNPQKGLRGLALTPTVPLPACR